MKKVLYLATGNLIKGTGFSQRIMRQMEILTKLDNIQIDIVNSVSIRDIWKNKKIFKETKKFYSSSKIKKFFFNIDPLFRPFKNLPNTYFKIKSHRINKILNKGNYDVIYCENLREAYVAYLSKKSGNNVEYILDYHGVVPEEFKEFGNKSVGKYNYNFLKKIEKDTIQSAKKIVCVSEKFKKYISDTFDYEMKDIFVVPSSVPENYINYNIEARNKLRKDLNISRKKVIIYAGSAAKYQCIDEMIEFFDRLNKYDASYFFLFLVAGTSADSIRSKFQEKKIKSEFYKVDSVTHDEINSYLMAADFGIILRSNSLVNIVSSPTKVLEYVAAGLPMIMTDNVGDFPNLTTDKVLLSYEQLISNSYSIKEIVNKLDSFDREQNFKKAKLLFDEEYTWNHYYQIYDKIFLG